MRQATSQPPSKPGEDSKSAVKAVKPPQRTWATSPRFSRIGEGAPDAPKAGALCQPFSPISERVDSRAVGACARPPTPPSVKRREQMIGGLSKRGENPPWGLRRCLWARLRHRGAAPKGNRTLPHPGPGISTWFPFAGGRDAPQPPAPCEAGTKRRASVPC
jgi:hypothetical protein